MCEACQKKDCENCTDWQPVPEGAARKLLEAIFGGDPKECCCVLTEREGHTHQ